MAKKDNSKGGGGAEQADKLTHSPFAALAAKAIAVAPPAPSSPVSAPEPPISARAPEGALLSARAPEGALLSARAPEGALRRAEPSGKSRGRLVLRRETKHRGGKAVIIVRGFEELRAFDAAAIEALAKQLKQSLGCGGTVESAGGKPEIVLQGDRAAKVAELLRARGFRVDGVTS